MDHSASAATKDAARNRHRRSCTPPRFSSTLPRAIRASQAWAGQVGVHAKCGSKGIEKTAPTAMPIVASSSGPAEGANDRFDARNISKKAA